MSSTYVVRGGDTLGKIFQQAHNDDENLTWKEFLKANSHIKTPNKIFIGDKIVIPNSKKSKGSTSAEPKEGKCGNEFTFHPRGKESSAIQVTCSVNGKKSSTLEADETYVNEQEKLEDSQSGKVEVTIDGNTTVLIEDLEVLKKNVTRHKDIKIDISMLDKEVLVPAQLPEFQSPDNRVTMTFEEFVQSQSIYYSRMQTLADFGIPVNTGEKHTMVVIEVPKEFELDKGTVNLDEMEDKAVEEFTAIMQILLAPGNKEALTQIGVELWGLVGLAEKRAFWKQMLKGGKYAITYDKGIRFIQFYPTTHFTAMMKAQPSKKAAKKVKKGFVKYHKRYRFRNMTFAQQFKMIIPWLQETKLGYLEKFLLGPSGSGTVFQILFVGTVDTAQWAMDEKSQAVDLWAVWGVVLVKVLAAQVGYAIGAATGVAIFGTGTTIAIVLTVGAGLVLAVLVAYGVGFALDKYKVKENFIALLRELEVPKRDDSDSLALQSLYMGGT